MNGLQRPTRDLVEVATMSATRSNGLAADRRIRVEVQVLPRLDWRDLRSLWLALEELGVDTIYASDHFHDAYDLEAGNNFECWTLLAAMAEVTERVELGPLVSGSSFRNPNLLADMARTIDHVSGGRLILGMGAGWWRREFYEYGFEWGTASSRGRILESAVETVVDRLPKLIPAPVRPIPILVGGVGEKITLKVAARHAAIWHGSGDPDTYRHKLDVLEQWCAEIGRDPAEIERAMFMNQPELRDPDVYLELGVTRFGALLGGPSYDLGFIRELLAWRDREAARTAPA
jgi:probable F420-dependent oxidoreductase